MYRAQCSVCQRCFCTHRTAYRQRIAAENCKAKTETVDVGVLKIVKALNSASYRLENITESAFGK